MSYLRYEKPLMVNLEESLQREFLRTNRSGAYACSTVVDCNTRKYHGLLVVPIPELDNENHVLLSSLDVSVIQHGAEFNLGLHKYDGDTYSPNGHKYIKEFDCSKVPTTTYRVGGVILRKETVFQHYENRVLIKYIVDEMHSPTTLRFTPFLAFRSVRMFTHENEYAQKGFQLVDNGIKMCMYPGYPNLYMQFSKANSFVYAPAWNKNIEYIIEQERGYDSKEDLLVPGYFEIEMQKGESIVFSASTSEIETTELKELAECEIKMRSPRDNFFHCLINSAHQFHNSKPTGERYLLAGYPWFKCRARDTFISLPGLTLAIGEYKYFELVMKTALKELLLFMKNKPFNHNISEISMPDVPLWAIWTIQQYDKYKTRNQCIRKYGKILEKIIEYILLNKHPNLVLKDNGLLYAEGSQTPVTWMNSVVNDKPVIPRTGYIVEFNALWFNALKFASQIALDKNEMLKVDEYERMAEKCRLSFQKTFVNEHGYLFDYVGGVSQDWSVRPNMIFAVALDYSPLSKEQQKKVLDFCTKELLTPKGLRSLSPKSIGYNPICIGTPEQRDLAYHQGTAWPWLGGFYLEACMSLYKKSRISFIERQLIGYEDEMFHNCISCISEMYDGNPPFKARGAMSYAMNTAEILRTLTLLETHIYNDVKEQTKNTKVRK